MARRSFMVIDLPAWERELSKVQKCPQRQDSTLEQLRDLRMIANKFGFYDAADYIRKIIERHNQKYPDAKI